MEPAHGNALKLAQCMLSHFISLLLMKLDAATDQHTHVHTHTRPHTTVTDTQIDLREPNDWYGIALRACMCKTSSIVMCVAFQSLGKVNNYKIII